MKTPVAILVRVSTKAQEVDRQISELEEVALSKGWQIVETCKETVSGASSIREGLERIKILAKEGRIKKVLVHEVSRVARKNSVAHLFLEHLHDCGVSLYWHTQGVETLLDNGQPNPATSLMFALLAEMARNEREFLKARIKSGQKEARKKGRKIGRPKGSSLSHKALLAKHSDILKGLERGFSINEVAKITGKGRTTVVNVKKVRDEQAQTCRAT